MSNKRDRPSRNESWKLHAWLFSSVSKMFAFAALALPGSTHSAQAASLEELRSVLNATIAEMPAVSVRYSVAFRPRSELADKISGWGPEMLTWSSDGERFALWSEHGGPGRTPLFVSWDGTKGFRFEERRPGEQRLVITSESPRSHNALALAPDVALGRAVPMSDVTLAEALRMPSAKFVGVEALDGLQLWSVTVSGVPLRGSEYPLKMMAWCDPARDMLPRRVTCVYELDAPKLKESLRAKKNPSMILETLRDVEFTWQVAEFMRVANPIHGGETWFPIRASIRQMQGEHEFTFERPQLLTSAPASWFHRPIPAGTAVFDRSAGRVMPVIAGGPKGIEQRVATAVIKADDKRLHEPPSDRVDATPRRGASWPTVVFCGSSILLALAFALWWRRM